MTRFPIRRLVSLALPLVLCLTALWLAGHRDTPPQESTNDQPQPPTEPTGSARQTVHRDTTVADPRHHPAGPARIRLAEKKVVSAPLPPDFLRRVVSEKSVAFTLPDGGEAVGNIELMGRDPEGIVYVQGRLTDPAPGFFFFQRQNVEGLAGPLVGHVRFDGKPNAWKVEPTPDLKSSLLVSRHIDEVVCVNYAEVPENTGEPEPENAPQTHPTSIPIPSYQTVIPLQSLPGATAVVYLDFDGEQGPFPGWGDFNAAASGASNSQIYDVWKMVCEDYQGFNINITTDRKVFDNAPEGRRQHCIISPTTNAAPGAGGVAYVGSFNWGGDRVCWAFYTTGKSSCEVIAHEVGHTLGLSHDGRTTPSEGYYGGHGTDPVGWAPIMGVGYYKNLSQWSKGEYLNANQTQDDLSIIVNNNNDVDYRADDTGDTQATAKYLEILSDNTVSGEGIIEQTGDVDAFRFATTGGTATLNVNTVSLNPNLDILAEIVNATTSVVVATANPDTGINATATATLTAGEYLLRVRGTGRGDPLGDGYTNYASLGSYLITGSVSGGVKSERFTIAENTANGTSVGTVVPRNNHGSSTLAYAIASGNANGAFSINSLTGSISVANTSALDFEALSLRWDDPATFEMFVTITDSSNPSLNETLRTVVTISDLNESPAVSGTSQSILEHTAVGTKVVKITATDADRFDFPTYSITAGNTGNAFAIDSGTGQITVAANIDVAANTVYNLTVRAADQGIPSLFSNASVAITVVNTADGYQPGSIVRTYFENISGTAVSNLTGNTKFSNTPDSQVFLTSFDGLEHGENYGSTIRGYLIPPATGSYQFWIASDDASELRLSSNSNPASATVIATVSGWTSQYAWTANASQQSSTVNLTAGLAYYIEARHKEGGGGDHVAVAWSGPGITQQVISGLYLAPYYQNYAPKVNAATFTVREDALAGQPVGAATSSDVNAQDTFSAYTITAGNTGGAFSINAATGQIQVATSGLLNATSTPTHTLTIQSTDSGTPALSGTGTVTVNVTAASAVNVSGIVQEIWTGISGTALTGLTGTSNYPYKPNTRRTLTLFDSGEGYADNYGSRIRAKFTPPTTGSYQFYIAGDDDCRLLYSGNANGTGASQIAYISGWTDHNVWNKYASQTSSAINLTAGQPVYLEALQKEGGGGDHVSVGYTGPDVTTVTVIPGSMLTPFDINAAPVFSPASYAFTVNASTATAGTAVGTVTATEPNGETLVYGILSGNSSGAFAINPATGTVTVTNPVWLGNGTVNLQVAAQDGGLSGAYPLKSSTATVTITVTGSNSAPSFVSNPITRPAATEDSAYSASVATLASDPNPGDTLTFSKTSGPSWLTVASNGSLSGTPLDADTGANGFVVRVTDNIGAFSETTLNITVNGVNHAPVFTADPIALNAMKNTSIAGTLAATDADTTETLVFSKVSGPAWLSVASDGDLSGTPLAANVGPNAFVVRVTDSTGLYDEASLNIQVISEPVWTNAAGGSWPVSGNWLQGFVADGSGNIADFATLDLTTDATVTLDGARTIAGLSFGDTTPTNNWSLSTGSGGPLTLNAASGTPSITVSNQSATVNAVLAGSQGWVKNGAGTLVLGAANSITGGLTINGGTVKLQSGDYTNTLPTGTVVTINSGGVLAVVNTNVSNPISGYVINPGGVLNCQGYHEHVSGVTLNGGSITGTGSGKYNSEDFALDTDLNVGGSSASSISIANGIGIGSGSRTFTVADVTASSAADLTLSGTGALRNSGTLVKAGAGTLAINNVNVHGATTVSAGKLLLGAGGSTGCIRNTLTVNAGAIVDYAANNTFGYTSGASVSSLQINSSTVGGANYGQHFWNSFQLGMTGGTLYLGGATNEWHNATVTVNSSSAVSRILGVGSTPQMRLRDGTPVTFNVADGPLAVDFSVEVPVTQSGGTSSLTKSGMGTMRMTAANTYTGTTSVSAGTLLVNGSLSTGAVTVAAAATFGGSGTVGGAIANSGTVSPGADAVGTLTSTAAMTLQTGSSLVWEIGDWNGAAGTGYDKLAVSGLVVNATSASPVTIRVTPRDLSNFTETSRTFAFLANAGSLTGFDPVKFVIDAGAFTAGSGTWALQSSGNNLNLVYTRSNTPPVFPTNPLALSATEDLTFSGNVTAADGDIGETLTYTKLSGPAWLAVSGAGALSGTPSNGDVGTNTFTVRVQDSFSATATLNLTITVANTNDAPVFSASPLVGAGATEDAAYSGTIAGSASDPDAGATLSYAKVSGPPWLSVSAMGVLSGTPANGDVGLNTFTVSVTDGTATVTNTLRITVANTNDDPSFASDPINITATEDIPFSNQLAATDPDTGDSLTFAKVTGPEWLSVSASGALTGTPTNANVGSNSFTVSVSDGIASATATLAITVANTNDSPAFTSGTLTSGDGATEAAYTGTLAGSASDPDPGDVLTYSKAAGPAWLTVASDGTLGGTPQSTDSGANTFTVRATDPSGSYAEASLAITVIQTNPDTNSNGILDTWETEKFGNANPGEHPANDDPDGDGLVNLMEFALGTHPLQANANPIVHDFETIGTHRHLRMTVNRNPLATDLTFTVETCGSLNDWSADDTVVETNTEGQLVVRDSVSESTANRRFIRLRVTAAP
ncbi:MAG: cadherin domain-containing protein [Verrucomicrobia bacterium]|nr:cadherin domain-containing protein [Verrucomicrobiota bacterium]